MLYKAVRSVLFQFLPRWQLWRVDGGNLPKLRFIHVSIAETAPINALYMNNRRTLLQLPNIIPKADITNSSRLALIINSKIPPHRHYIDRASPSDQSSRERPGGIEFLKTLSARRLLSLKGHTAPSRASSLMRACGMLVSPGLAAPDLQAVYVFAVRYREAEVERVHNLGTLRPTTCVRPSVCDCVSHKQCRRESWILEDATPWALQQHPRAAAPLVYNRIFSALSSYIRV